MTLMIKQGNIFFFLQGQHNQELYFSVTLATWQAQTNIQVNRVRSIWKIHLKYCQGTDTNVRKSVHKIMLLLQSPHLMSIHSYTGLLLFQAQISVDAQLCSINLEYCYSVTNAISSTFFPRLGCEIES